MYTFTVQNNIADHFHHFVLPFIPGKFLLVYVLLITAL